MQPLAAVSLVALKGCALHNASRRYSSSGNPEPDPSLIRRGVRCVVSSPPTSSAPPKTRQETSRERNFPNGEKRSPRLLQPQSLRDIARFVLEHLDEPLSVERLARALGMSVRSLTR